VPLPEGGFLYFNNKQGGRDMKSTIPDDFKLFLEQTTPVKYRKSLQLNTANLSSNC
jgi:hypothetical protein